MHFEKGAGQHVAGHSLPSTFTNQTVCQPTGTEVFGEDILLLVDKNGLVCKYAGQASSLPPFFTHHHTPKPNFQGTSEQHWERGPSCSVGQRHLGLIRTDFFYRANFCNCRAINNTMKEGKTQFNLIQIILKMLLKNVTQIYNQIFHQVIFVLRFSSMLASSFCASSSHSCSSSHERLS